MNVVDFTVDGKCSNCGNCCIGILPISSSEIAVIKAYIEKHNIKEQTVCYPVSGPTIDATCPFRSMSEKKCLIYPVRPWICRNFLCNQSPQEIGKNKYIANKKWYTVDMREVFYGNSDLLRSLLVDITRRER